MSTQEDVDKFIYAVVEDQFFSLGAESGADYHLLQLSGVAVWVAKQYVRFSSLSRKGEILKLFPPFANYLREQTEKVGRVFDPQEREGIEGEVIARVVVCEMFKEGFKETKSYLEVLKYFHLGMGKIYRRFRDVDDKRLIYKVNRVTDVFIDELEEWVSWVHYDSSPSFQDILIPKRSIPFLWGQSFSNQTEIHLTATDRDRSEAISKMETDFNNADYAIGSCNFAVRRKEVLFYTVRSMLEEVKGEEFLDKLIAEGAYKRGGSIEKQLAEDLSQHPEKMASLVPSWFVFWLNAKGVVPENVLAIVYFSSQALLSRAILDMAEGLIDYSYESVRPQIGVIDKTEEIVITQRNKVYLRSMRETQSQFGPYAYIGEGNITVTLKVSKRKPIGKGDSIKATVNWHVQVFSDWTPASEVSHLDLIEKKEEAKGNPISPAKP